MFKKQLFVLSMMEQRFVLLSRFMSELLKVLKILILSVQRFSHAQFMSLLGLLGEPIQYASYFSRIGFKARELLKQIVIFQKLFQVALH